MQFKSKRENIKEKKHNSLTFKHMTSKLEIEN